ncbi:sigma-70 family RNA polymerase sigma factor [Cryomorpha ignava]|uniref:Sigma-70 family RNA polymerase sigma factor n=1 Tax=Cryomorpha ignava TaxID=101383 RepID=A0A7K3WRB8_9FLAO|nr:sigma-70 family RNA polymerase sigma factor [Cryomorpha ignava]NEN24078.1 sigma-70 family RNA polymerase sigma factor [Cryomorpha ignava]
MKKGTKSEVEDMQLAEACLTGNEKAQAQLFDQYSGQMMALCLRYGRDYEEARDMFQDGFIKVFQKLDMYNGKGPLGAWIRRTIANNALDQIRKNKREKVHEESYQVEFKYEHETEFELFNDDENELTNEKLTALIETMPTGYRTVFNMYVVEDYSHKEIAEQLGITESTSKTQYRKAKAYMRNLIEEELNKSVSD